MKTFTRTLVLFLVAMTSLMSHATADGCIAGICGKVKNQSSWQLRTTDNPNCAWDATTTRKCDNKCNIWNWSCSGATGCGKVVNCKQLYLSPGFTTGGNGKDIDAFTYADREYFYAGKMRTRGVWSKFNTLTTIVCKDHGGYPCCGPEGGRYGCTP
ncbi:hypothetical protein BDZ85DRAFT_253288 [Elsinoe ampelina]|uniref:Uncharacterized protein n=1 Tax=Elsinoe ampelina TaxID=302913 RepID=A0A6A6FZY1_9PEZI|nr:hypothetical protein BDZ85DRAFT_253288 [Elsinoe ampelina]